MIDLKRPAASPAPRLGYLVKAFPRISETFILNEVLELERRGFDLRIYALNRPRDKQRHRLAEQVRSPLVCLPEPLLRALVCLFAAHLRLFLRFPWGYVRTLGAVIWAGNWDLVERFVQVAGIARLAQRDGVAHLHAGFAHAPASVAWLLHRITGLPFSVAAHAKDLYHSPRDQLRWKLTAARAVLTCTRYNVGRLHRIAAPGRIRRLRQIYHGTDLSRFAFGPYGLADPPLILAVARLVEKKGLEYLIRACATLQSRGIRFRSSIIGDGALRASLERLSAELKLEGVVSFKGTLPQEVLREQYRQATVMVLPCVVARDGDRDGIPNVLVEAAACGVPIVTTPTSGIPELIQHGQTGVLVPPREPEPLARAIEELLGSPPLRERLRSNARAFVEQHFDLHRNVAAICEELRSLLRTAERVEEPVEVLRSKLVSRQPSIGGSFDTNPKRERGASLTFRVCMPVNRRLTGH